MTKVEQESDKFKKTLGKEVQNGEGLMGQKIKAGQYSLNELSAKFESKSIGTLFLKFTVTSSICL